MSLIYFSLTSHVYAARYENSIIILDSFNDQYLSFIDDAAQYFEFVLNNSFQQDKDGTFIPVEVTGEFKWDLDQLNSSIMHFIGKKLIFESSKEGRKIITPLPLRSGGLIEYCWDHKPSWKPFVQASKIQTIKAFCELVTVHRIMKKKGIKGILDVIKKTSANLKILYQPTEQEINKLAETVDAASILYPKKTYCLAWASTFVLLALKKNWPCNLAIGIQTNPFYAHAWAEIAGKVIHDDPIIAQVLSVILREPNS